MSDEEEIEEELGFISPLDTVNPYVRFKQALASTCALYSACACQLLTNRRLVALEVKDREVYQAATTSLNVEQQTLLMEIMRIAEEGTTGVEAAPASAS